MTLKDICEKYPERYVILVPMLRDAENNKPLTFKVLRDCLSEEDAVSEREYYAGEGYSGVFIYPTFGGNISMKPSETAKMFHVLMGGV